MILTEGIDVVYENYVGKIKFVCDSYATLCVNSFPEQPRRDVCMLIYRKEFDKIKLLKESEKW